MRGLRMAGALALLAVMAPGGGPAGAQTVHPVQACVINQGGYVARVTFNTRPIGATSWTHRGTSNITNGSSYCLNWSSGSDIQVVMEVHTGFNWAHACTRTYTPAQNVLISMRGTTLHPSCTG